jgi:hypothetical protein
MKISVYVMAPEPISTAYFINPSRQSVESPIVARQRLGKHVPAANNTCNNRGIVQSVDFYAVRVVSKSVGLCIPSSLLGNGSVNTFPLHRASVGGIFYVVRVVSKEVRQLVIDRTTCFSVHRGPILG